MWAGGRWGDDAMPAIPSCVRGGRRAVAEFRKATAGKLSGPFL